MFSGHSLEKDFELLKVALNASTSAIVLTDNLAPNQPIVYCNASFERITQYTKEEILGRNCRFLQGTEQEQPERYVLREAIKRGSEFMVVLKNYRKDGSVFWNELYLAPVKDNEGIITHFIGVLNDISERVKIEKQKEHFFSVVGHELRTPVTSLKASLQIIEREVGKEKHYTFLSVFLKKSIHQINRLVALINGLLDNTRIHTGKMNLTLKAGHIEEVINNALQHVEQFPISVTSFANDPVLIDKVRMEQVLTNLLTNAIKYSGETKKIAINVCRVGAYLKVAIKDLGIGISKEKLPYVFDLFYRTHEFSPLISGLGLGLFISSEIVKRHGGEIGAESEPGKGSTFWFTLPVYAQK